MRGVATKKTNGKPRPLAMVEVLMNVVAAAGVRTCAHKFRANAGELSVGWGKSGGSEQLITLADILTRQGHRIVKVDFKNAYGTIKRRHLANAVMKHVPEYINVLRLLLGETTHVYFTDRDLVHHVEQTEGICQGSVDGPALFQLGLGEVLAGLRAKHGEIIWADYLDDVFLVGDDTKALLSALKELETEAAKIGLCMNRDKTELYGRELAAREKKQAVEARIKATQDGTIVLGVPVGTDEYVTKAVKAMSAETSAVANSLRSAATEARRVGLSTTKGLIQHLLEVLRMCVSSKFTHIMRAIPPRLTREAAHAIDASVFVAMKTILNIDDDEVGSGPEQRRVWEKASLPISGGGIGMMKLERVRTAAWVGRLLLVASDVCTTIESRHALHNNLLEYATNETITTTKREPRRGEKWRRKRGKAGRTRDDDDDDEDDAPPISATSTTTSNINDAADANEQRLRFLHACIPDLRYAMEEIKYYDCSGAAEEDRHIDDLSTMDLGKPLKKKQKALTAAMNASRVGNYEERYTKSSVVESVYWQSQLKGHAGRLFGLSTVSPTHRMSAEELSNVGKMHLYAGGERNIETRCLLCEQTTRGDKYHALGCDVVATNQQRHAYLLRVLRTCIARQRPDLTVVESEIL
ncbi:MAG TPA: reverse transcriptase domain-containing protein [Nitrospira sp.]|nr:reverse transcriptase domain-containing protein [Nitrospira sp.]